MQTRGSGKTASPTLADLRQRYLRQGRVPNAGVLKALANDPRIGAQQLYRSLLDLRRRRDRERRRQARMYSLERSLWARGLEVGGVDEAGVGCLAGPVVAAAVILPSESRLTGINDSKQLDPELRDNLAQKIRQVSRFAIGMASVEEIDELNVYWAALLAMRRAVSGLQPPPNQILVDAREIPELNLKQHAVVKGDAKHASIAAASIVAKTERDRLMDEMSERYPGYGFHRHKGYCTPEHQDCVRNQGLSPIHRRSYAFLDELTGNYSDDFYQIQEAIQTIKVEEDWARSRRRLQSRRHKLSACEKKKLLLMLNRKKKQFPQVRQMSLLGGQDERMGG